MGGREKRLANFDRRAAQFERIRVKNLRGPKSNELDFVKRATRTLIVGRKSLRLLAGKPRPIDLKMVEEFYTRMGEFYESKGISPTKYILARPKAKLDSGIQEYFHRPGMNALGEYFELMKYRKAFQEQKGLNGTREALKICEEFWCMLYNKEDFLLCKKFVGDFKNIKEEDLVVAFEELGGHYKDSLVGKESRFPLTKRLPLEEQNTIVLGKFNGKIRLAIVDF